MPVGREVCRHSLARVLTDNEAADEGQFGCGSKEIDAKGETEQRLYVLPGWREAPFYTERERAALEWTEAVTLIGQNHVPDDLFDRVRKVFSEKEMVDLTMAVIAINGWNRLAVGFRAPAGSYVSHRRPQREPVVAAGRN